MIERIKKLLGFERKPMSAACGVCGGSGWSPGARGNGYDDVCGECIYGQVLTGWSWRWISWPLIGGKRGVSFGLVRVSSVHMWKHLWRSGQWFGVFRNHPDQGPQCKQRWGVRVVGLEIGSRG